MQLIMHCYCATAIINDNALSVTNLVVWTQVLDSQVGTVRGHLFRTYMAGRPERGIQVTKANSEGKNTTKKTQNISRRPYPLILFPYLHTLDSFPWVTGLWKEEKRT